MEFKIQNLKATCFMHEPYDILYSICVEISHSIVTLFKSQMTWNPDNNLTRTTDCISNHFHLHTTVDVGLVVGFEKSLPRLTKLVAGRYLYQPTSYIAKTLRLF